jgi:hypothetical protein
VIIAVAVLVALVVVGSIKDVARYLRMRKM